MCNADNIHNNLCFIKSKVKKYVLDFLHTNVDNNKRSDNNEYGKISANS